MSVKTRGESQPGCLLTGVFNLSLSDATQLFTTRRITWKQINTELVRELLYWNTWRISSNNWKKSLEKKNTMIMGSTDRWKCNSSPHGMMQGWEPRQHQICLPCFEYQHLRCKSYLLCIFLCPINFPKAFPCSEVFMLSLLDRPIPYYSHCLHCRLGSCYDFPLFLLLV